MFVQSVENVEIHLCLHMCKLWLYEYDYEYDLTHVILLISFM